MEAERAEALEVLRDLWRGQAQGAADLDACGDELAQLFQRAAAVPS